ncbi:Bug family tripartite tricarboxylate transporter substrate binding protein [Variovorax sp. M-6]|uniref:Bug family tripartite tricarboxylate transporter substrate binding protein n=1 Tax=Variovorax sp. M-6 TaxID=3233041 RepID=UPI003F9AB601
MKAFTRRSAIAIAFVTLAASPMHSSAQDSTTRYPDRPIRIVITTQPGGSVDGMARLIAEKLGTSWGRPVIVENRAGGNGAIATSVVANAAPDGYTILFSPSSLVQTPLLMKNPPYRLEQLTPVAMLTMAPYAFAVGKRTKVDTLADFIAWTRGKPDGSTYGSGGAGSAGNIMGGTLARDAQLKLTHVPFKGELPAIQAVMGGDVDVVMGATGTLAGLAKSGELRLLAVAATQRLRDYPDVPTFAELGYPAVSLPGWSVALVPAGTPRPLVDKLSAELSRIVQLPDVSARIHGYGFQPQGSTPDAARAFVAEELQRWRVAIEASGVSVD